MGHRPVRQRSFIALFATFTVLTLIPLVLLGLFLAATVATAAGP